MGKDHPGGGGQLEKGPKLDQVFEKTWKQVSIRSEKPKRDFGGLESL